MAAEIMMGTSDEAGGGSSPYQPFYRTERYPGSLHVDFRKLQFRSLQAYVERHHLVVRDDATQEELAIAVGKHFESYRVNEEGTILAFVEKYVKPVSSKVFDRAALEARAALQHSAARSQVLSSQSAPQHASALAAPIDFASESAKKNSKSSSHKRSSSVPARSLQQSAYSAKKDDLGDGKRASNGDASAPAAAAGSATQASGASSINGSHSRKRKSGSSSSSSSSSGDHAKPGEQVAVLEEQGEDELSGFLARVIEYDASADEYDCQDEDDMQSKLVRVESRKLVRLSNGAEDIESGGKVMAVFPDTTSFYYATVQKIVKNGNSTEVVVCFYDDEDENGNTPGRQIPARFVMPIPNVSNWSKGKRSRQ